MNDFLVFDLETQRSALEVGGWQNIADMKMSVGVVWDSSQQRHCVYYENDVMALIRHLKSDLVSLGTTTLGLITQSSVGISRWGRIVERQWTSCWG